MKDPNIGLTLIESFKNGPLSEVKFNTGEQAVVRVMIKHKQLTPSECAEEDKKNENRDSISLKSEENVVHKNETGERWMELDQDDKALAITGRPAGL